MLHLEKCVTILHDGTMFTVGFGKKRELKNSIERGYEVCIGFGKSPTKYVVDGLREIIERLQLNINPHLDTRSMGDKVFKAMKQLEEARQR